MADALKHLSLSGWSDDGCPRQTCERDNVALAGRLPPFFILIAVRFSPFPPIESPSSNRQLAPTVALPSAPFASSHCTRWRRSKAVTGFIVARTFGPLLMTRSYRHCARHCSPPPDYSGRSGTPSRVCLAANHGLRSSGLPSGSWQAAKSLERRNAH